MRDPRGDGCSDEENSSLNSSSDKSQPGISSHKDQCPESLSFAVGRVFKSSCFGSGGAGGIRGGEGTTSILLKSWIAIGIGPIVHNFKGHNQLSCFGLFYST